jgi:phenylpropionate dioxygenase-like ring-hydroxylating dioxygenase large terminal subunit
MFLKNTWYVAATASEVQDKPLGRKICGESMVLYRGEGGKIAALEDFCPHRGAPLSLGRVCNGNLVCGYHGLEMGCDGKTVAFPRFAPSPRWSAMVLSGSGQVTRRWPTNQRYRSLNFLTTLRGPMAVVCITSSAITN